MFDALSHQARGSPLMPRPLPHMSSSLRPPYAEAEPRAATPSEAEQHGAASRVTHHVSATRTGELSPSPPRPPCRGPLSSAPRDAPAQWPVHRNAARSHSVQRHTVTQCPYGRRIVRLSTLCPTLVESKMYSPRAPSVTLEAHPIAHMPHKTTMCVGRSRHYQFGLCTRGALSSPAACPQPPHS